MAYEDDFQDVTDVQDKIKKLQKHQAFEAEILANTDQINKIKEVRHCSNVRQLWIVNLFSKLTQGSLLWITAYMYTVLNVYMYKVYV